MSKNCPNCGFELKDLDTKKIEVEIRKEFEEKEVILICSGEQKDTVFNEYQKLKVSD